MAIRRRDSTSVRDISALARRVHERWLAYRRRNSGMSIPVDDTLSRLFEHVPEYRPARERSAERTDRASKSPGVFKLQQVADMLETTVGDLLGEEGYVAPRDLLSTEDRRTLRNAIAILRDLFDLDDDALDADDGGEFRFVVSPAEFIERDHDYPRVLHVWRVPEHAAAAGNAGAEAERPLSSAEILHNVREVWDSRLQVIRVIGDSMTPELRDGWKVLVDTQQTRPAEGAVVAVYVHNEGGIIGRWYVVDGRPTLRKSNTDYPAIVLGAPHEWKLWGTVTKIVDAPVNRR
jgi:hypothetical protein